MSTFAYTIVKEPPGPWEVEVEKPSEWAGRFRSQDGVEWWSPRLERPLGEHHNDPGEAGVLLCLQAAARDHVVNKLKDVATAARHLLAVRERGGLSENSAASDELAAALRALDGTPTLESRKGLRCCKYCGRPTYARPDAWRSVEGYPFCSEEHWRSWVCRNATLPLPLPGEQPAPVGLYVGDGHPALRARYEREDEPEEHPQ